MRLARHPSRELEIGERLSGSGLRLTVQRRLVYRVLLEELDHPTAEEVFLHAKRGMPEISLATVYNCLDALVQCGLARRVNVDPAVGRFCPNMTEHSHFYCRGCGGIFDVDPGQKQAWNQMELPAGFRAEGLDLLIRGTCAACGKREGQR